MKRLSHAADGRRGTGSGTGRGADGERGLPTPLGGAGAPAGGGCLNATALLADDTPGACPDLGRRDGSADAGAGELPGAAGLRAATRLDSTRVPRKFTVLRSGRARGRLPAQRALRPDPRAPHHPTPPSRPRALPEHRLRAA
ncbi:hypothetical protein [Streptomyces sp. NPDC053367]|uniref:hypothetical protein n=1 Tax=Streptomyces sp. NPDC053367 TaxID=3365700 RepID=UPI0037D06585